MRVVSPSSWFARHAVVVALALVSPRVAWSQPAPPTNTLAAQERFNRGRELYERQQDEAALTEFRASLELYPSPNTRLYVGLCLGRLGRLAEAYVELDRAAHEANDLAATNPRYASTRDLARRELSSLEARIGRLQLRVNDPPEGLVVRVGETTLARATWGLSLPYDPGAVQVNAEAPGYQPFRRDAQVSAGGVTEVVVRLERAPEVPVTPVTPAVTATPPPQSQIEAPTTQPPVTDTLTMRGGGVRTAGYVVAGVGVAGVAAFAVLGTMAGSRFDTLQRECMTRVCTASEIDDGERLQTLANVSLGVGVVSAITGAIMIIAGGPTRAPTEAAAHASRWSPWLDASRGMVGVRGAF